MVESPPIVVRPSRQSAGVFSVWWGDVFLGIIVGRREWHPHRQRWWAAFEPAASIDGKFTRLNLERAEYGGGWEQGEVLFMEQAIGFILEQVPGLGQQAYTVEGRA